LKSDILFIFYDAFLIEYKFKIFRLRISELSETLSSGSFFMIF